MEKVIQMCKKDTRKKKKFHNRTRNEKGFYIKDKKMHKHDEREFALTVRERQLRAFGEKQSYPHHRKDDNGKHAKNSGDKFQGKYKRDDYKRQQNSQEKHRVKSITSSSHSRSRS